MATFTVKHILIIRFRQIGDSVLSTVVCNTLKDNFPHATIDMVLNDKIASLFEHHPSIDGLITFTNRERHHLFLYLRKVHKVMRATHYDVIIDMRSTMNTLPFSLFSLSTPFRIGLHKFYNRFVHNYRIRRDNDDDDMLDKNLMLLQPLESVLPLRYSRSFSLFVTPDEIERYKQYLIESGIDFSHPVMLVGVTSKLSNKSWNEDYLMQVLRQLMKTYPTMQLIFNFVPGVEEERARDIFAKLGSPRQVYIGICAHGLRELAALSCMVSFYFGNEGGTRHIIQAMGIPSFVICSPSASKKTWIPVNDIPSEALEPADFASSDELKTMSDEQLYRLVTPERVWEILHTMLEQTVFSQPTAK